MIRLIIYRSEVKIDEIFLDQGSISIGRKRDNDICLEDRTVSGYHAKIDSFFRPTYIEDLCSTNGTYVNGKRVKEHTLADGDVITIGTHELTYESQPSMQVPAAPDQTMELNGSQLRRLLRAATQAHAEQTGNDRGDSKLINWIAQDAAGVWWGFEAKPTLTKTGWQAQENTHRIKLRTQAVNDQWSKTLRQV